MNIRHYALTSKRSAAGHQHLCVYSYQSGAVMVISLIMLLLLTLIGVTGSQVTGLEEKMSGNMRDRNIAFQAAEAALRDAERDIISAVPASARDFSFSYFESDCGASTEDTSDDGLCYQRGGYGATPIWTTTNLTAAPSVGYGSFTGAMPLSNLSAQPRYIIEGVKVTAPGQRVTGVNATLYYRITVRAQGANANTVVLLQSTYKPE